jgi:hypothetical protein
MRKFSSDAADRLPRRVRARRVAAAAGGLLLTALVAAGQALAGPMSGLAWPSGAKDGLDCLAQLRGRAVDVTHVHVHVLGPDFPGLVQSSGGWLQLAARQAPVVLFSFALLPASNKGQFADCAAGTFDGYWRQIGANLARITDRTVIVEPGWEANLGSAVHPWGVDDVSQIPAYKACFQHAAAALRAAFPAVRIAWTSSKVYRKNYTVDQMNPGDAWFDVYGLLYYDNVKPLQRQTTWDKYVNSLNSTGRSPSGIGAWLAYATSHGKKLGVSEWGIWDRPEWDTATADDPVYIDNMYRFFKKNAANIAYEAYQNNNTSATDGHQLCPTTPFPRAQRMYAQDWQAG